ALDKGARLAGDTDVEWVVGDATQWRSEDPVDLAVIAYLQLPAAHRRAASRNALESLRLGGTFLLVAHDSTNLVEGTGGPQDPAVLMTAEDVLADLDGFEVDVVRAGRVAREVVVGDDHRGEAAATAWDCLVRLTRR
ncbi:MAG: class I SAM-dependent methyltransferase, partial [Nocardioides sp.]